MVREALRELSRTPFPRKAQLVTKSLSTSVQRRQLDSELATVIPADILELLGPPALTLDESPSRYRDVMAQFAVEFDPNSITEWLLVNDLVNINWEILRYRRVITTLVRLACPPAATRLVYDRSSVRLDFAHTHFRTDALRPSKAGPDVTRRQLAMHGLTLEDVFYEALSVKLEEVERFDKLIEKLEIRREKLFREFRAHRTLSPELARQKTTAIVEQLESDAA